MAVVNDDRIKKKIINPFDIIGLEDFLNHEVRHRGVDVCGDGGCDRSLRVVRSEANVFGFGLCRDFFPQ